MKRSLFFAVFLFAVFLLCAAAARAEMKQFISSNVKKVDINMLGGSLKVTAVRGSQNSYVDVQSLNKRECDLQVSIGANKELIVRVRRLREHANCSANISAGIPERAALSVTAFGTNGEISNFRRSLFLDIRDSNFYLYGFKGGVDIVAYSSGVVANGFFREVLISSNDRSRAVLNWAQNPQHLDIEIRGDGDISLTFPKPYDIKKVTVDKSNFSGFLSIENR